MRDENFDDADCAELARILRQLIDADRYPLSPRVRRWRELVAKLDPSPPVEPYRAPVAWVNSRIGQRRRTR